MGISPHAWNWLGLDLVMRCLWVVWPIRSLFKITFWRLGNGTVGHGEIEGLISLNLLCSVNHRSYH